MCGSDPSSIESDETPPSSQAASRLPHHPVGPARPQRGPQRGGSREASVVRPDRLARRGCGASRRRPRILRPALLSRVRPCRAMRICIVLVVYIACYHTSIDCRDPVSEIEQKYDASRQYPASAIASSLRVRRVTVTSSVHPCMVRHRTGATACVATPGCALHMYTSIQYTV